MSPVADTILAQLGGARVFAMAFDAGRSSYGANVITLRIATGLKATGRATHVVIRLEAGDTYTVETHRIPRSARVAPEVLYYQEGVYADSLRMIVEDQTGLRLSL